MIFPKRILLAVYAPYVKQTAITFEYEVSSLEEFAGRIARPAYDWAVETSIYVPMDCRRMGIGHKLYEALIWSGWKSLLGSTKKTSLRLFHFRSCRKSFCSKIIGNARGWKK